MASSNVKNMSRTKAMGVGVKNSPTVFNGVHAQSQLSQKWLLNTEQIQPHSTLQSVFFNITATCLII